MFDWVHFEWIVTLGQVLSTLLIFAVVAGVYLIGVARHGRTYRRIDMLEAQLQVVRDELDRLARRIKTEDPQ